MRFVFVERFNASYDRVDFKTVPLVFLGLRSIFAVQTKFAVATLEYRTNSRTPFEPSCSVSSENARRRRASARIFARRAWHVENTVSGGPRRTVGNANEVVICAFNQANEANVTADLFVYVRALLKTVGERRKTNWFCGAQNTRLIGKRTYFSANEIAFSSVRRFAAANVRNVINRNDL